MKTKNLSWKALFIAIIALFSVSLSKAQCPTIANQLSCPIEVRIYIYQGINPTGPCTGAPIVVTVPASTSLVVNCPPGCLVNSPIVMTATLVRVNGVVVTPITADTSIGGCGGSTTIPTACGGSAQICVTGVVFTIN